MDYLTADPTPDKHLQPDGSIVTRKGVVVSGPDELRAMHYLRSDPTPDKWLNPDGSVLNSLSVRLQAIEDRLAALEGKSR